MGINDARLWALKDGGFRTEERFLGPDLLAAHPPDWDAEPPVAGTESIDALQGFVLRVVLRDDPLADLLVRDGAGAAKVVEEVAPADAELGLERVPAVVEPRVDDLAVAGGGFGAGLRVSFQEEGGCRGVFFGEAACGGEAYDAASDDLVVL